MPAFGFNEDGIRRIRAMLRWFEAQPRAEAGGDQAGPASGRALRRGIVTTAVTAGSSTAAGTGQAKLQQRLDPAAAAYSDMVGQTTSTVSVKVWNPYPGTIAVGKIVLVTRDGDDWMIVGCEC